MSELNLRVKDKNKFQTFFDLIKARENALKDRDLATEEVKTVNNKIIKGIINILDPIAKTYKVQLFVYLKDTHTEVEIQDKVSGAYRMSIAKPEHWRTDNEVLKIQRAIEIRLRWLRALTKERWWNTTVQAKVNVIYSRRTSYN